ncbi:MAG: outer membrane beta-barrel protein [Acidobacteriaceae bacterium]|nr:outer membrane beta-barrel protein [Acidobacteriaceae bacterium]
MKLRPSSSATLLLAALISSGGAALGQSMAPEVVRETTYADSSSNGGSSGPQPGNGATESAESQAALGPVLPENIRLTDSLISLNALTKWGAAHNVRFFGWADGGYTWASTGTGLLEVEPRMNRFGDAWLLNQAAFVVERALNEEEWSWGFRSEFYMGADPALLHPLDGFGPSDNPRFSTDFRQAYFSFHAPILTDGGVDFKLGRQYVPLGYETTMAPYRPFYSLAYVWLYSQNGATTGAIATIHVNPRLDVIGGVTLGVNSLFDFRGRAPCYIARGLYWLDSDKRTKLVGTFYTGPQPIAAAKGHIGKWQTEAELQLIHEVNRRLTLVSETNFGWDNRDPANNHHTSKWYGTYGMTVIHAHRLLDVNSRAEWFRDADGSRIGTRANYGEITTGINFMPTRAVNFRPEVRWDGADNRVFGPTNASHLQRHQWTYAFEMLLKF